MCADGLKGLPEAISSAYPKTEFQRCIVHMIRNTMTYVSYQVRKELAADLKTIYAANTEEEAYSNLQELKEKWTQPYHNWGAIISEFRIFFEERI